MEFFLFFFSFVKQTVTLVMNDAAIMVAAK